MELRFSIYHILVSLINMNLPIRLKTRLKTETSHKWQLILNPVNSIASVIGLIGVKPVRGEVWKDCTFPKADLKNND